MITHTHVSEIGGLFPGAGDIAVSRRLHRQWIRHVGDDSRHHRIGFVSLGSDGQRTSQWTRRLTLWFCAGTRLALNSGIEGCVLSRWRSGRTRDADKYD